MWQPWPVYESTADVQGAPSRPFPTLLDRRNEFAGSGSHRRAGGKTGDPDRQTAIDQLMSESPPVTWYVGRAHGGPFRWTDWQSPSDRAKTLVCVEIPPSREDWLAMVRLVTGPIHLLWEPMQVEPDLSSAWLTAFCRELQSMVVSNWSDVVARHWETTTLMVRSAIDLLQELGLLTVRGQQWKLRPPDGQLLEIAQTRAYQTYLENRHFRRQLANGSPSEMWQALTS